jgi:hypothetical protein
VRQTDRDKGREIERERQTDRQRETDRGGGFREGGRLGCRGVLRLELLRHMPHEPVGCMVQELGVKV